ncbi:MAG TPA: hypothetical protein VFF65_07600 [Phycisphaerales bacterium]|nr:hypothetical protein [Phycisphaerales bacterium]
MADMTFTVSMDANQAAQVMRQLKGQASDAARAVEKSFNTAVLFGGMKAGFRFLGSAMEEYAKESEQAKKSVESIGAAWRAVKAEVGFGLMTGLDAIGVQMPTPSEIRQFFGLQRAAVMGALHDPAGMAEGAIGIGNFWVMKLLGIGEAGGKLPIQHLSEGMLKLTGNDALRGGVQAIMGREAEIARAQQDALNSRKWDLQNQTDLIGGSQLERQLYDIERERVQALEEVKKLKQENAALDDQELISLINRRAERKKEFAIVQDTIRLNAERFADEERVAAHVRRVGEERRDFRQSMKRSEEDRDLAIRRMKSGDTLKLAIEEAELQAKRDIEAIKREKAFNDPAVQKPYIDKRNEQLKEEIEALKAFYGRKNDHRFSTVSGGFGGTTMWQALGGPFQKVAEAVKSTGEKQLDVLRDIKKNTETIRGHGDGIALMG